MHDDEMPKGNRAVLINGVRISGELATKLDEIAAAEHRTRPLQVAALIEEAIKNRRPGKPIVAELLQVVKTGTAFVTDDNFSDALPVTVTAEAVKVARALREPRHVKPTRDNLPGPRTKVEPANVTRPAGGMCPHGLQRGFCGHCKIAERKYGIKG